MEMETGQFQCTFTCVSNAYRVVEDGNKQCVSGCPRYYEEKDNMKICKDYCESGMSDNWKCVSECPKMYELIETLENVPQFNCLDDCNVSVEGNTARRTEVSHECVKRCDEDRVGYLDDNGNRICGLTCPGTQRIDDVTRECDSSCYYQINGSRYCVGARSCNGTVRYWHSDTDVECVERCGTFSYGDLCVDQCP